ncbi:hypothetical protein JCM8208_002728 [Rhodotorula glutinis]
MPAVVPYDPPARSRSASRRSSASSIFDRVREGLVTAEHLADEAGQVAATVGKAARTAQVVEDDLERAYGGGERRDKASGTRRTSASSARRMYGGDTTEGESDGEARAGLIPSTVDKPTTTPRVVPYRPASSTTRQRKKRTTSSVDSVAAFSSTVETTQEAVDNLADDIELIASQRHRLTGLAYSRLAKLHKRRPLDPPRTRAIELDEAEKLAALVGNVKPDLERAYQDVSALQPRLAALLGAASSSPSSSSIRALKRAHEAYDTLTRSFAAVLDFVEDRAKEEKRARDDGQAEQALLGRMKDDHPEWDRARLMAQLQRAKKAAGETTLVKVDYSRDPYTGRWLLQQPFTALDDVLQAIDLAENGVTKRDDEKTGSWALGSLLSRAFSPTRTDRSSSSSSRKPSRARKSSRIEREVAKSHRYRSEDKPRAPGGDGGGGDSSDEKGLLSNKGAGRDDDSDDSFDASNLPERVPTDDTSGYVESREELIEDAKAQRRTEHFYTPLVIVYWVCIAILYLYYFVARLLGFDSPLGNVDLGSHFGNQAWNDTQDGLVLTSATTPAMATTTSSEEGPRELTRLPSATSIGEVLDRASSLEALVSSMSGTVTASAVEGTVTAMAVVGHGQREEED